MKTINIKDETHKKLKKIAENQGISMSSFLDNAVKYFEKTKLNPKTDVLSVKEEIIKLERRTNQVVAFIKNFENTNLIPACEAIEKTSVQVNEVSEELPTIADLQVIGDFIKQMKTDLNKLLDKILSENRSGYHNVKDKIEALESKGNKQHIELLEVMLNKELRIKIASKYNIVRDKTLF
jgi:phage I-like protein